MACNPVTLRETLTWLVCLAALTGVAPPPSSPSGSGQVQRIDYRGDIRAFIQSLPPSLGKKEKLIPVVTGLATGYPKEFEGLEIGPDGRVMVWAAGQKFIYDDGATKTFEQRLDRPDIEDMFSQTYPLTNPTDRLPQDFDPGRYRVEAFFLALYGEWNQPWRATVCQSNFAGIRLTLTPVAAPPIRSALSRPTWRKSSRKSQSFAPMSKSWPAPLTGEKSPERIF